MRGKKQSDISFPRAQGHLYRKKSKRYFESGSSRSPIWQPDSYLYNFIVKKSGQSRIIPFMNYRIVKCHFIHPAARL